MLKLTQLHGFNSSGSGQTGTVSLTGTVWQINFASGSGTDPEDLAALDHNATGKVWNRMVNTIDGSLSGLMTSEGDTSLGVDFSFAGVLNGNWGNPVSHPGYASYNYNGGTDVTCQFSHLPEGMYDVLVYGHGAANNQAGRYRVVVGSTDYGYQETAQSSAAWNPPLPPFIENTHYVRWNGVSVAAGQNLAVLITNPATGGSGYRLINMLQVRHQ